MLAVFKNFAEVQVNATFCDHSAKFCQIHISMTIMAAKPVPRFLERRGGRKGDLGQIIAKINICLMLAVVKNFAEVQVEDFSIDHSAKFCQNHVSITIMTADKPVPQFLEKGGGGERVISRK